MRARSASSCAATRCVVAVASASARTSGSVEARRRVLDLRGQRRDLGPSLPQVRFQRARALGFARRCGGVRPRPRRALAAAARRVLRPVGARAARRPRPALRVRVARGVRRATRRRRASLRPRPSSAPHPRGDVPLRARRAPSPASAPRPASPRSRRSNRSNATDEPEAELRTVGPARPQRRREQRQVAALDRGRDEVPRVAVAPLREHAGNSRLRAEPGEHTVAEPFVFVERAAQRARARTPQEAAAVESVQVPEQTRARRPHRGRAGCPPRLRAAASTAGPGRSRGDPRRR